MRLMQEEFGDSLQIEWRSYLLRARPEERSLESFRKYTESWQGPASQDDSGEFRAWSTDEGPPSHSIPPHVVAKAAATISSDGFTRVHDELLNAYFTENRDITATATLEDIWLKADLPAAEFARRDDPELLKMVLDEHNEAIGAGANGVPAFRTADNEAVITGAHPTEVFRNWISRKLEAI